MKICIIKLGALGDVIRTIPILEAIKAKYPESEILWVTKPASKEVLENNPAINKVLAFPIKINEEFDILYNFDIEKEATNLAITTNAKKKFGFYSEGGYPAAFNLPAEYYLNTLFDDELKKTNKKTYQEMIFEAAELDWKKQKISLYPSGEDEKYAEDFFSKNFPKPQNIIGIHIGSSPRWPSKSWHEDRIKEFIALAKKQGRQVLLLAGPDDIKKQKNILETLGKKGISLPYQDTSCTLLQFASLVNLCSTIICADSLALHVSLAMNKKTVALFFCTSPNEVEGYNLLEKIASPLLKDFFPEKSDQYSEELVKSISVKQVLNLIEK